MKNKNKTPSPVGQTPKEFLLKEAKTMHKGLNPRQKILTSVNDIYHILRKEWRKGTTVDREERQKI